MCVARVVRVVSVLRLLCVCRFVCCVSCASCFVLCGFFALHALCVLGGCVVCVFLWFARVVRIYIGVCFFFVLCVLSDV